MDDQAQITKTGALDCQVCVPADWTDERVKAFADMEYVCGTTSGWQIRREGDPHLAGAPERVACAQRDGFVHVMLDA